VPTLRNCQRHPCRSRWLVDLQFDPCIANRAICQPPRQLCPLPRIRHLVPKPSISKSQVRYSCTWSFSVSLDLFDSLPCYFSLFRIIIDPNCLFVSEKWGRSLGGNFSFYTNNTIYSIYFITPQNKLHYYLLRLWGPPNYPDLYRGLGQPLSTQRYQWLFPDPGYFLVWGTSHRTHTS